MKKFNKLRVNLLYRHEVFHYSLEDVRKVQDILGNHYGPNNEYVEVSSIEHFFLTDEIRFKKKYDEFKKYEKNIFYFIFDVYQLICTDNIDPDNILHKLYKLEEIGTIVPSINFMYLVGTKKYVVYENFRKMMLENTLIYPDDKNEILSLKSGKYIIKHGLSSNNVGNYEFNGNGKQIVNILENIKKNILLNKLGYHEEINKNISKHLEKFLENMGPADIHKALTPVLICSEFAIVQRYSDLYERCSEWRFFVLNDKIIGLYCSKANVIDTAIIQKGLRLNKKIYEFIKNVIREVKKISSDNYFFVRIDITLKCDSKKFDSDYIYSNYIFRDREDFKIYLNEIEPLGSGLKARAGKINDNGEFAEYVANSKEGHIIEGIVEEMIKTIDNLSKQLEQNEPTYDTNIITNLYDKYVKYKNKYLALKNALQ